ncbi:hypothetical protein MKW98_007358 [Papaver atlanticum]|uniref:Phytocyanin domain-containing protein n=1 Tax=Papaver atlanticum TaxID=357466 RepID=A0AAD4XBI2_9MAGN|nr:hypothetical protein MKW98_007358 [Papaver atlanticum]
MTSNVGLTGFLLVFVIAFASLHHSTSDEIDVLDTEGWHIPSNGDTAYLTWAATKNFKVGDTLVFRFPQGEHDVATVSKEGYDNCMESAQDPIVNEAPVNIRLNSNGPQYFICTIGQHCKKGQRLTINVSSDSEAETPSNSPTTNTTLPITPTPRNSASHTATGGIALALLFISTIFLH